MAKDKKKGKAAKKSGPPPKQKLNPQQKKQLKKATDGLIREGNELQERAQQQAAQSQWPAAIEAITGATAKYTEALQMQEVNLDALYNLGTCELHQAGFMRRSRSTGWQALREQAMQRFQLVLTQDTSGRGETSGLAHQAIAGMFLQQARKQESGSYQQQHQLLKKAVEHFEHAERIQANLSGVDATLCFHWAEALELCMRLELQEMNEPLASSPQTAKALQFCETAIRQYDQALASCRSTVSDSDCLWAKASLLLEFCRWAVEESRDAGGDTNAIAVPVEVERLESALGVAYNAAVAFLQLVHPEATTVAAAAGGGGGGGGGGGMDTEMEAAMAQMSVGASNASGAWGLCGGMSASGPGFDSGSVTLPADAVARFGYGGETAAPSSGSAAVALARAHNLCGDICDLRSQCTCCYYQLAGAPSSAPAGAAVSASSSAAGFLTSAARHYELACAADGTNTEALQGLGEMCFELAKAGTTDRQLQLQQAGQSFRRALELIEAGKQTEDDGRDCLWYNLACVAALSEPLDEAAEAACEGWLQQCVAYDEDVCEQMATDPDLHALRPRAWFQLMLKGEFGGRSAADAADAMDEL